MKIEEEQLLALVRLAIHPKDDIPKVLKALEFDWEKILEEAKKQSLIGIAFVGFKIWSASEYTKKSGASIDKRLLMQWVGICEKIREDNLLLNKRTSQVCKNFTKDGFRVSIMKGQGNALLYGKELSLLRSPGDIDVWVEGGFHKIYDYVKRISPPSKVNELEMDFNVFSDAEVEVHYRPFILRNPFRNKELQEYFSKQSETCFTNKVQLMILDNEGNYIWDEATITTVKFNLVHQLAHIHLHLFTYGIGLRQIMDYYYQLVFAEKTMNRADKDSIVKVVSSLNLEKLAKAITWILSAYFGLKKECMLWKPDRDDGLFLLNEILESGNFGGKNKHQDRHKGGGLQSFIYVQKRNLALMRFDKMDWFWGSLWRVYYYFWRRTKGYS